MHIIERGYQLGMGIGMKLMPAARQEVLAGPGSLDGVPRILEGHGHFRPLIVTGPRVGRTDFFQRLEEALRKARMEYAVFSQVEPDPGTDLVKRVMEAYRQNVCDSFIALGGGSNMDAAKGAAAGLARPEKELTKLGGVMKVRRRVPYLVAIPTTAGTGSECTVAAVLTDSHTHRKFAINDPVLCPDAAVLDSDLTESLPPAVVAATGMDALTHAVEAYLNRPYHKRNTGKLCMSAVRDIMLYLPFAYEAATENEKVCSLQGYARARQKLLEASYRAGQAFTVACVGNVHAVAHTLGGLYHIPHGEANAALLPVILEDYGKKVHKPLARLAVAAGLDRAEKNRGSEELARRFISHIRRMNRDMGLADRFPRLREEDFDQMAEWAVKEANPLYPVPVIYGKDDVKRILRRLKGE